MRIWGFIGASGTGKSYRAQWVAKEREIDFIIDDGLLINGNRIVAGMSAKKEQTKIASVKRALFTQESHALAVKNAINENKPKDILILGTSDGMVESIVKALGLPEINQRIYIQDVATVEEMEKALNVRRTEGKHVIPVPTFEIKKQFSGYFLDSLKIFKGKEKNQFSAEKSIVRPTFSYMGRYIISDAVIYDIVEYVGEKIPGVHKIQKVRTTKQPDGILLDIDAVVDYGADIYDTLKKVQEDARIKVEELTALNIYGINILAKSLYVK